MSEVKLNPKGRMEIDQFPAGQIIGCERDRLERLLGVPHTLGDGRTISVEWFLVAPAGRATIRDHWSLAEGDYRIMTDNKVAAAQVVKFLKDNGINAGAYR